MTKRKKLIINIAVLVLLVGVTMTVLLINYKELSFKNIGAFLKGSHGAYVAAAVGCMLLSVAAEGFALWVIVRRLGHKSRMHQAMVYSTADIYYSAITPSASGGQPASLFYMVRDGMSAGAAGFSLILNLFAYTSSILIMGAFAFIAGHKLFWGISSGFARVLIILGTVCQLLLLGFFLVCMLYSTLLRKAGNGLIKLGAKMKIVKRPEKWHDRWNATVEKYRSCREVIKKHPFLFMPALLFNLLQRVSQTLIPCLICRAVSGDVSLYRLFIMQVFVLLGYNSLPVPGGVGAYEYLYLSTNGAFYSDAFLLSAMMVSRFLSFYLRMVLCAVYTLAYHSVGLRKKAPAAAQGSLPADAPPQAQADYTENGQGPQDETIPSEPETGQKAEAPEGETLLQKEDTDGRE